MAAVEVGAPAREVAPERIGRRPAQRDDSLLRALAGRSDEPLLEIDVGLAEPNRFADAQPGTVEQLHQRAVAQRTWRRPGCGVNQPFGFRRRERTREPACLAWQRNGSGGVVAPPSEQHEVAIEGSRRRCSSRDRRR